MIGFTGTQKGMILPQRNKFTELVIAQDVFWIFHHGCCVGADEQAHHIVREHKPRCVIHLHVPSNRSKIAQIPLDDFTVPHVAKPYLTRNRNIVSSCAVLFAAPKGMSEETRSGTWATIRYAREQSKRVVIIWPNGNHEVHG